VPIFTIFNKSAKLLSLVFLTLSISTAQATTLATSPDKLLEHAVQQLLFRIDSNQQALDKFPDYMRVIIEEELTPLINYQYMAYKILGKHLAKATKAQKALFVTAIHHYLIKTYAGVLAHYGKQKITFSVSIAAIEQQIIDIKTKITDGSHTDTEIIFIMHKNKADNQWQAVDMVLEGRSLLSAKQVELNPRISKHGIEQAALELYVLAK